MTGLLLPCLMAPVLITETNAYRRYESDKEAS